MAQQWTGATWTRAAAARGRQAASALALVAMLSAATGCSWMRSNQTADSSSGAIKPDRSSASEQATQSEVAAIDPATGETVASAEPAPASAAPSKPARAEPPRNLKPADRVVEAERLASEGRIDEAIRQLEQAIRDNPKLTTAYISMADIYRQQGNYAAAEKRYRDAVELDPSNFDAISNHALMLHMMGRLSEAVRQYLRALALRPRDRETNLNLATAYLQLNEPAQALPYAQMAVNVDPDHGPGRVNLGAVLGALDRHQDAVKEYEAAAELMDLNAQLLLNWADSLSKIQRYQEAVNTLERLLQLEVDDATAAIAYERLGSSYFRLRQYDRALDAFRLAVQKDSTHYPGLNGVGVCLLNKYLTTEPRDKSALDEALRALRRSLQINERQPRIVELLSRYG